MKRKTRLLIFKKSVKKNPDEFCEEKGTLDFLPKLPLNIFGQGKVPPLGQG